jgi:hypothetical protein
VRVQMATAGALDGLRHVVFSDDKDFDFAHFERPEHAAQSGDAAAIGASLIDGFANHLIAALVLPLRENRFGPRSNLRVGQVGDIGGKASDQLL